MTENMLQEATRGSSQLSDVAYELREMGDQLVEVDHADVAGPAHIEAVITAADASLRRSTFSTRNTSSTKKPAGSVSVTTVLTSFWLAMRRSNVSAMQCGHRRESRACPEEWYRGCGSS